MTKRNTTHKVKPMKEQLVVRVDKKVKLWMQKEAEKDRRKLSDWIRIKFEDLIKESK